MGGNGLMPLSPPAVGELVFSIATRALGIDFLSPTEQVNALLAVPAEELDAKVADTKAPIGAVLDNDVIPNLPSFKALADRHSAETLFPGMKWCKRVFMGDCQLDVSPDPVVVPKATP
jgi:hypothetical protein